MADFMTAISALLTPYCLLMCVIGGIIGLVLGAIPGLSGGLAITILLPMTFTMDSNVAIAMLISIWVGSCSGGFIGSVLLGIPGTGSSLATCYDGYEMTKKGEVTRALSVGTVANFLGTVPSILIAMIACPIISAFALKMGPWEYFGLGLMAISMVVSLSKGQMLKGLISASLGLLITQVGYDPISSIPRFTFDSYYLVGGFNMISVLTGIFAGTMILTDFAKGRTGAAGTFTGKIGKFQFPGKDFINSISNVIRSFLIGLGIGFLPGLGAALSNVVAYAMARNSSKHPEQFGTGCVDGVIAPEVANNASVGGAIIPMVSLGIPGDGTTALLLGGLTIHGIEAGPLLQQNEPVFVYMIYMAAVLGAIIALFHDTTEDMNLRIHTNIEQLSDHVIGELQQYNSIWEPSGFGVQRLEDVLVSFSNGELYNVDRSWGKLQETFALLKKYPHTLHQALMKAPAKAELLDQYEMEPTKFMFMPIIRTREDIDLALSYENINMVGFELLAKSEDDILWQDELIEELHEKGYFVWYNAITLSGLEKHIKTAGHDDDCSIKEGFDKGWGVLIDKGIDVIQTDWPELLSHYRDSRRNGG